MDAAFAERCQQLYRVLVIRGRVHAQFNFLKNTDPDVTKRLH